MCTTVTGFLASIKDIREAKLIASSEVDIIDLKNIDDGALGFVGRNFISKVRKILPRHTLSATMGNHMNPNNSENIENIKFVIKNKIDFLKIGLFDVGIISEHHELLKQINFIKTKPICVLFADKDFNLDNVEKIIDTGYHGVMIDTYYKDSKSLVEILENEIIKEFINIAKSNNKFCGLSGSLRLHHINQLKVLSPDFLGFRGQLCEKSSKRKDLSLTMFEQVARTIKVNS